MLGLGRGKGQLARLMKEGIPLDTLLRYSRYRVANLFLGEEPRDLVAFSFERSESFFTRHVRPRDPHSLLWQSGDSDHSDTAIVVQGPLGAQLDFTFATILFYRRAFPGATTILSTWDGEDANALRSIEGHVDHLVLNQRPPNPGLSNGNLQLVSTQAGIECARDTGAQYVLKTRTDQRLYEPSALSMLKCLIHAFPPHSDLPEVTGRLVTGSLDTFKYRLYGLSDQLMFGFVGDMERYWSCPLDSRHSYDEVGDLDTLRKYAQHKICEVAFATHYLSSIGWNLRWTLTDYWSSLAAAFIIVDTSSLDLLWPKYSWAEYRWRRYARPDPFEEMSFAEWASILRTNVAQKASTLEAVLDLPLSEPWSAGLLRNARLSRPADE